MVCAGHQAMAKQLIEEVCLVRAELPDGYAFRFSATVLSLIAAFVNG